VCVFDYRTLSDHQLQVALDACAPDMAADACSQRFIIAFLTPEACGELLLATQDDWPKGLVVPYAEAGYPTAIPLTAIEERLEVAIGPAPGIAER
jgi:hypothetical protein